MAIKLQDFARQNGVTDRTVQKHLKKHEKALEGHFERKGPHGTWLDEYAQDFIREHLIQSPIVVYDDEAGRLKEENLKLQKQLTEAYQRLSDTLEYQRTLLQDLNEQKLLAAKVESAEEQRLEAEERARAAEDIAEAAGQDAETAKGTAAALQAQLDELASSGRWKRKKLVKKLRKDYKAKLKEAKNGQYES